MSLPAPWVDRLFERLTLAYGRDFSGRWEGLDTAAVKADWATALAGYEAHPEAIAFALEHLPTDRPPTVLQFAELCRRAPLKPVPALPAPAPNPEVAVAALSSVRRIGRPLGDRLAWAVALREREERKAGRPLTEYQRKAWRDALGFVQADLQADGQFGEAA